MCQDGNLGGLCLPHGPVARMYSAISPLYSASSTVRTNQGLPLSMQMTTPEGGSPSLLHAAPSRANDRTSQRLTALVDA